MGVPFSAGAFAAIFLGLRFFEQAGRLSRARHLLQPAFYPSWMVAFFLISYLAAEGARWPQIGTYGGQTWRLLGVCWTASGKCDGRRILSPLQQG